MNVQYARVGGAKPILEIGAVGNTEMNKSLPCGIAALLSVKSSTSKQVAKLQSVRADYLKLGA